MHTCLLLLLLTVVHSVMQDITHLKNLPAPAVSMLPSPTTLPVQPAPALPVLPPPVRLPTARTCPPRVLRGLGLPVVPGRAIIVLSEPCPPRVARLRKQRRLSDLLADAMTLNHTSG